jgi:nucleoside-diphosphate-sugar epimerase
VYVDDVVDALVRLAAPGADGLLVNVGSGTPTTILSLTAAMSAVAGSDAPPSFGPPDWTAGSVRCGDVRLAASALGWTATTPLHEGLTRVWRWMVEDGD